MAYFGSDHFPLFVRLSLEPRVKLEEPSARRRLEDFSEAREKLERVRKPSRRLGSADLRQVDDKGRALAGSAVDADVPATALDDPIDDR